MPRPPSCRRIGFTPDLTVFKPAGIPGRMLAEVVLSLDELEAIRLADLGGFYQEQAASQMGISRQTFGSIISSAHGKLADCIVHGKMLRIEGGAVMILRQRRFQCSSCGHVWNEPHGTGRPAGCPTCQGNDFHRAAEDRSPHGRGQSMRHGGCRDAAHGHRGVSAFAEPTRGDNGGQA